MTSARYPARVASPGMAYGTLRRDRSGAGHNGEPAAGVIPAILAAAGQLRALQSRSSGLGSDILEFQLALLEDDHLAREMLEAADASGDPARGVREVLGAQIADFAGSASEQFSARAADLADLRDRLLGALAGSDGADEDWPEATILLAEDMTPSRFLSLDRANVIGIVDRHGSTASHVALLARSHGMPMLVDAGAIANDCDARPVLLDGEKGELLIEPEPGLLIQPGAHTPASLVPDSEGAGPAVTPQGATVQVHLTVNALDTLGHAPAAWFDGIGLVRSELLIRDAYTLRDAVAQADLYRPLLAWAGDLPVTIRLIDAGGDKQVAGLSPAGDERGARLLMEHKDVLRAQLSAILQAADGRPVRIMVPMITRTVEMDFFRAELDRAGGAQSAAQLGMMVETPAAALEIASFDADFYALGTNDLTQYTLAAARESDRAGDFREMAPAVVRLVGMVIEHAAATGKPATVCGDVAPTPEALGRLLDAGVRSFCVPPRLAPRFKQFIRTGR
jgi:phosphotransferase system enzyme I (PtsI)